jgi:predicted SAM-dependent methyltransferase
LFIDDIAFLHFAPEKVFQKKFKAIPRLNYYSADLMSSQAETHVDITRLCYKDNRFDAILCSHVLEHVLDDRQAMHELVRVLKPGGWAILQTPIDPDRPFTFEDETITIPEDRTRLFGQYNHVRIYGCDYKNRLEDAGFNVRVDDYVKQLGTEAIKRHGLNANEDIYLCLKPT